MDDLSQPVHPLLAERLREDSTYELLATRGAKGELTLRGQVDRRNCESLGASIVGASSSRELRVDVSELAFIDVAGMRAIGEVSARLEDGGRQLTLVRPRAPVKHLMTMLGLDEKLSVGEAA